MKTLIDEAMLLEDDQDIILSFIAEKGINSIYISVFIDSLLFEVKRCPHCNSRYFYKAGHLKNQTQRYKCHNCLKTFSRYTNSVFEKSKLTVKQWFIYILCLEADYTLEECAKLLNISIVTSFHMRHKLLKSLES